MSPQPLLASPPPPASRATSRFSLTWRQAAPRRSSAQTFLQRKRETTNSCPMNPPAKFQLRPGILVTSSVSELELASPETEGLPGPLQGPWKKKRRHGDLWRRVPHWERCPKTSTQGLSHQLASWHLGASPATPPPPPCPRQKASCSCNRERSRIRASFSLIWMPVEMQISSGVNVLLCSWVYQNLSRTVLLKEKR